MNHKPAPTPPQAPRASPRDPRLPPSFQSGVCQLISSTGFLRIWPSTNGILPLVLPWTRTLMTASHYYHAMNGSSSSTTKIRLRVLMLARCPFHGAHRETGSLKLSNRRKLSDRQKLSNHQKLSDRQKLSERQTLSNRRKLSDRKNLPDR
jgi:hypothetical protein